MLINNAVITGSLTVNGTDVTYITGSSQISSSFLALSSSYLITSASYVVTSGSYAITSASFAQTSGSLSIRTGNLEATSSTLTSASSSFAAQSASLSTRLTADETNITTLTNASASFAVVSSSFSSTSGSLSTRVTNLEATSSTVSSSFASTSGSIAGRVTLIEGQYATTGSNNFTGPQFINQASNAISFTSTASLYTDGGLRVAKDSFVSGTAYFNNITVYGTSSIEYITSSQVNIGSNVITVNTDTPAIRFGGISVFDSGSTQLTGSLFWDSEKNHWIYSNPSGSSYNSAMLMNGPRNTGSLGTEQGTTNNALMKGQGGDHITSSQMIDDGTTVQIPGNLQVTGSIVGSSTVTATNGLLIGNGGATATSGYVPKFTGTSTIGNSLIQDNGSTVSISTSSTVLSIDRTGGATALLELKTGGTVRGYLGADASMPFVFFNQAASPLMRLDASGNLGLGVTPSVWTLGKAIEIGNLGHAIWSVNATQYNIMYNTYYNGGFVYASSNPASYYQQASGAHTWYNAPSGTAGTAITFTSAMALTAAGRLLINTPTESTYQLDVNGTGRFYNTGGSNTLVVSGTGSPYKSILDLQFSSGVYGATLTYDANPESLTIENYGRTASETTQGDINFRTKVNNTTPTNVLNIDGFTGAATFSGNVGIGIAPTNQLHLYKASGTVSMTLQTNNLYGYFYNDGTNIGLASDSGTTGLKLIVSRTAPDSTFVIASTGAATFSSDVSVTGIASMNSVLKYPTSPYRVYRNLARFDNYNNGTGAIAINTSIPWSAANMLTIQLKGYLYEGGVPFDITFSCYAGEGNFYSPGYFSNSANRIFPQYAWYKDVNDKIVLVLGATSGTYGVQIWAAEYKQGFQNLSTAYADGWTITKITTTTGLSNGVSVLDKTYTGGVFNGDSATVTNTGIDVFGSQLRVVNSTSSPALITYTNTANGFAFGFNSTTTQRFSWYNGAPAEIASLNSTGTFTCAGDVVAFGTPSDLRLKTIKEKVPNALDSVLKLNGYKFDWKEKDGLLNIKEDIGVIAQEVAEVFPELARTNADGNMSVRYQGLTAVLIEAIKEQQTQIEELKTLIHGLTK